MTDTYPGDRAAEAAGAATQATTAEATTTAGVADLVEAPLRPIREAMAEVGAIPVAASFREGGGVTIYDGDEGDSRPGVSGPDADGMVTMTVICKRGPDEDDEPTSDGQCAVVVGEPEKKKDGLGGEPCLVICDEDPQPDGSAAPDVETKKPTQDDPQTVPEAEDVPQEDAKTPPHIEVNAPYSDGTLVAIENLIKTF